MPTTLTDEDLTHFRGELLAHCYQMLGSVHEAEDLVQETLLRAWRARDGYDETRASVRTWLHRIATNACLTALADRSRRPLPSGLGTPWDDPEQPLAGGHEVPWMQPFPDAMLQGDPAAALLAAGRLRVGLAAALQLLPPRQRAILILREALALPAAEVAAVLDTTTAAVNSGLQRARARLAEAGADEDHVGQPADAATLATVDRYATAFEDADLAALKRLLAADVIMEMPPFRNWYAGAEDYTRFLARVFRLRGTDWRMVPAMAGGQPAMTTYLRAADGTYQLHSLQVFLVAGGLVRRNVVFADPAVFALFGLAPALSDSRTAAPPRAAGAHPAGPGQR